MAISVEDVRSYVLDHTVEDNDLVLDLAFSNEEIEDAMKRAARAYNSIPPLNIARVEWNNLPDDTNIFLDATVEQLYITLLAKLIRNDIDYTAGGVTTNLVAKRISHLREHIKEHRALWQQAAGDLKKTANISMAFRTFE